MAGQSNRFPDKVRRYKYIEGHKAAFYFVLCFERRGVKEEKHVEKEGVLVQSR